MQAQFCCYHITPGKTCNPKPGRPCRYRHDSDDGLSPCNFKAKCRQGHKRRSPTPDWSLDYRDGTRVGVSPADRDAELLRSQLEPLRTEELRIRLVERFGRSFADLDCMERRELMPALLDAYALLGPRILLRREGTAVSEGVRTALLAEMRLWAARHGVLNHRPSIKAESYTVLRSPGEFGSTTSRRALRAAKKVAENQLVWDLAMEALHEVDPEFEVSALAINRGFTGSPHIDKQNSGPFYGLSLGTFPEGEGGIRVEAKWDTVVEVNSKNRLARVDGRYVHWVGPYTSGERYSLIYYQTTAKYTKPRNAVWPPVTDEEVKGARFARSLIKAGLTISS